MEHQRIYGTAFLLLSALTFSTAGLFVKGVSAGPYAIIFWRSVGATAVILCFALARGKLGTELKSLGGSEWAVAICGAIGTLAFVPAFKLTSIAHVAMIYAVAPFVSAIIAWCWLREKPRQRVVLSSGFVLLGVALIVRDSHGDNNLYGDALALIMTVAMALLMCIYRRYPHTRTQGPAALMATLLIPVGLLFDTPLSMPLTEIALCLLFGLIFALASVTLAEGARRLPAAETALLSALEMPFAVLWAALFFAAYPSQTVGLGGMLIAVAIVASQWPGKAAARSETTTA